MALFEVQGPIPDDADRIFAPVDILLWRQSGRVYLEVRSAPVDLLREAALAGLSLRPASVRPAERPRAATESHGRDLRPVRCEGATIDRLEIRPVPLAAATRTLLRRPMRMLPLSADRRARCQALLQGEDAAYRVTRVVWSPRAALRDAAFRQSLRPVVFDRGGGAPTLARTARSGDLARWLRG